MSHRVSLNPPKIFFCHSSQDKPFVEWLAMELKSHWVRVWLDKWEIKVGDSIVEKINEGIRTSDYLAVVLSKNSVNSAWVKEEINSGMIRNIESNGVFLLPLLIEDCDIPPLLSHRKYADFRVDRYQGVNDLIDAITPHSQYLIEEIRKLLMEFERISARLRIEVKGYSSPFDNRDLAEKIEELNCLMEAAVHYRFVYEIRTRDIRDMKGANHIRWNVFYDELKFLESIGVKLSNKPIWGHLRNLRNHFAHPSPEDETKSWEAEMKELVNGLSELKKIISYLVPQP